MELKGIFWVFSFLLGLCVGSFINVVAWRWPRGQSVVYPSSHCPKCQEKISWFDNIPLLSYLLLRGKCRSCGEKISLRYPVIELISGLLSVLAFWCFGLSIWYLIYYGFLSALFTASIIDLEHRLIPDEISIGGAVLGVGIAFLPSHLLTPLETFFGAVVGFLLIFIIAQLYYLFTKREGMGMGDAKLLGMIGAFLGWRALGGIVFLGSLLGIIIGSVAIIAQGKGRFFKIPFGPFLSFSALIYILIWCGKVKLPFSHFFSYLLGL